MAKWITRTPLGVPASGSASKVVPFTAASAGSFLLAVVSSWSPIASPPAGWTLLHALDDVANLYLYTKTAAASEASVTFTQGASGHPLFAVIYEFPGGTTILDSDTAIDVPPSGVASVELTGMAATAKLLMAIFGYVRDTALTPLPSIGWNGDEVTDIWQGQGGPDGSHPSIYTIIGYLEDSALTTFTPVVSLASSISPYNTARVALAISVGSDGPEEPEEPTPLATPTVTITAENDPTTIGGTNGSIQGTIGSIDPNADRVELGIATGHGQTTGFVTVNADAPTPFTITGRGAGNYTVGVRAHPAS